MMRFRPEGLVPSSRVKAELRHADDAPPDAMTTQTGGRA